MSARNPSEMMRLWEEELEDLRANWRTTNSKFVKRLQLLRIQELRHLLDLPVLNYNSNAFSDWVHGKSHD